MKSGFFIVLFSILVFAQELSSVDNGFVAQNGAPKQVQISVIDNDKANELFRKFVQNKDIPFKYPIDGCYARAHEMARMAETEKVLMGKIFAEGSLQVKTDFQKYPIVQWGWHVAPIAYVKKTNGQTELMVFDPSLFTRPISVDEWKQKMMDTTNGNKPKVSVSYYGARFQYFPRFSEGYKDKWSERDLQGVRDTFKTYQPLQDLASASNVKGGTVIQEGVRGGGK